MVISMTILREIPIRTATPRRKRLCDLVLDADGKVFIVDVEVGKHGKEKFSVCIDEELKQILSERDKCVN